MLTILSCFCQWKPHRWLLISWSSSVVRRLSRRGLRKMNYFSTPISLTWRQTYRRWEVVHFPMFIGTSAQLRAAKDVTSVVVASASLHPADEQKSLGVIIDSRLTFATHALAVRKACNYHIWALWHIRHLLTLNVAKTLACSIVGARLDYCNSILYGAPLSAVSKLQRVQNSLSRVVLRKPNCDSSSSPIAESITL